VPVFENSELRCFNKPQIVGLGGEASDELSTDTAEGASDNGVFVRDRIIGAQNFQFSVVGCNTENGRLVRGILDHLVAGLEPVWYTYEEASTTPSGAGNGVQG
jgi:hypothetical protein